MTQNYLQAKEHLLKGENLYRQVMTKLTDKEVVKLIQMMQKRQWQNNKKQEFDYKIIETFFNTKLTNKTNFLQAKKIILEDKTFPLKNRPYKKCIEMLEGMHGTLEETVLNHTLNAQNKTILREIHQTPEICNFPAETISQIPSLTCHVKLQNIEKAPTEWVLGYLEHAKYGERSAILKLPLNQITIEETYKLKNLKYVELRKLHEAIQQEPELQPWLNQLNQLTYKSEQEKINTLLREAKKIAPTKLTIETAEAKIEVTNLNSG